LRATGFYEEIGSAIFIFQCRIVIYPYVPGFICTAFFYLVLNLGPLFMIFHSFFMIHYHYSRWSTPPRRSTPRRSATKMLQGAEAEKAAAVQVKLDDLMKGKVLSFWPFSWDLHATDTNAPILNGLAAILKEAPQLAINIHGEQMAKSDKGISKDAHTGKTFEECFPGIENTVRPDAVARARVLSTLKALKDLGCTNTMTVTHVFSTVKQVTFQVKGVPAEAKKKAQEAAAAAKAKAGWPAAIAEMNRSAAAGRSEDQNVRVLHQGERLVCVGNSVWWYAEEIALHETEPVIVKYEFMPLHGTSEVIGAFSLNRRACGEGACDALTWYAAPHRHDLTFRGNMFATFFRDCQERDGGAPVEERSIIRGRRCALCHIAQPGRRAAPLAHTRLFRNDPVRLRLEVPARHPCPGGLLHVDPPRRRLLFPAPR